MKTKNKTSIQAKTLFFLLSYNIVIIVLLWVCQIKILDIYYEKEVTEEDMMLLNKQISELESSIERRKKLLSNENYVAKAPKELVEKERLTLKAEEEKLAKLKNE